MADNKTDFYIQAALLDTYIHSDPSKDSVAVKVITRRLKQSEDLLRYFFSQSPSPDWAEYIFDYGLFDNPPQVEIVENGYKTPFWPQSNYLRDIAHSKPAVVIKVVQNISTNNPTIHADLVEALIQLPVDISITALSVIKRWLENEYIPQWNRLPEAVSQLIVRFMENNQKSIAIELLNELLRPKTNNLSDQNNYSFGSISKSRFELSYCQPDFWKVTLPYLETHDHEGVFQCILKNFKSVLQLELPLENISKSQYRMRTSGWRSSIGDTSQDIDNNYKSILLRATRDSLFRYVNKDKSLGKKLIGFMMEQDLPILTRIAIYVTAINADLLNDLTTKFLLDKNIVHTLDFHNEYFELLKQGYPVLSKYVRKDIISLILEGPLSDTVQKLANTAFVKYGENVEDYKNQYVSTWIRDRLWVIKQYLETEESTILNGLLQRFGEPHHPEFLSYISEAFSVKEESPLSVEQILAYNPGELINYINNWEPDESFRVAPIEISHRGFAKAIANAFFEKPKQYSDILEKFSTLPSPYISEIFSIGQSKLKEGQDIPWEELITLMDVVVALSKNIKSIEESKRSINERLCTLWFISTALQVEKSLPVEYFEVVEKALITLTYDIDPDDLRDNPPEGYVGFNDPITLAINSVRPMALNSLFSLIQLDRKIQANEDQQRKSSKIFIDIKNVLDDKLDRRQEQSWAVHSIFGERAHLLYSVDFEWFSSNISAIFPEESENEKYFLAAWESYLYHNNPNPEILPLLRRKYIHAIKILAEGKKLISIEGGKNRLALHILKDYFWNHFNPTTFDENNLLGLYFSLCDGEAKGSAIWALWRLAESIPEEQILQYWPKIKEIWKWRTNEFVLSGYSNEYYLEFQWFSYLLLEVPKGETISRLNSFLEPMITFIDRHVVWGNLEKYLANQVEMNPELAIKYYRLMHEKLKKPEYGQISYGEASDKIIITAIKNVQSKRDALATINMIGRINQRYRKIYEENT